MRARAARLGQHFLRDRTAIARIVAALDPQPGETLLEIGPGEGVLTEPVLARAGTLTAIELDPLLAGALAQRLGPRGLRVIEADALTVDYGALVPPGATARIFGNLPYYLSTPLLFRLLEAVPGAPLLFMLQREVVDRLAARPGGGEWGRLSVMAQYRCAVDALFRVPPGAFTPPPRVESRIVRLVPHAVLPCPARDERRLARVVSAAFAQRRKKLRNALAGVLGEAQIRAAGVDPSARPETLGVAEFVRLADQDP
jgi:16S rRNA (adenine1518-N6/adenine1519-N6)-dimethyltransferase